MGFVRALYFLYLSNISKFEKISSLSFSDIALIIISSAGLLHGVLFGIYLIFFKKRKSFTNRLL